MKDKERPALAEARAARRMDYDLGLAGGVDNSSHVCSSVSDSSDPLLLTGAPPAIDWRRENSPFSNVFSRETDSFFFSEPGSGLRDFSCSSFLMFRASLFLFCSSEKKPFSLPANLIESSKLARSADMGGLEEDELPCTAGLAAGIAGGGGGGGGGLPDGTGFVVKSKAGVKWGEGIEVLSRVRLSVCIAGATALVCVSEFTASGSVEGELESRSDGSANMGDGVNSFILLTGD